MSKSVVKKICFSFLFLLLIVACYFYLAFVLTPKDMTSVEGFKYYQVRAYKYEKKNTVDIGFYGNSNNYSGISPMEIYNDYGFTSLNFGFPAQEFKDVYAQVKNTLKYQKLKVVAIEAACMFPFDTKRRGSRLYDIGFISSPFNFHTRWWKIKLKDFFKPIKITAEENYTKGYRFFEDLSNKVYNVKLPDNYMQNVDALPMKLRNSTVKTFDKIYKLCKSKGVMLYIYNVPSPKSWNNAKHNAVQQLIDSYNLKDETYKICYEDFNIECDGFDFSKHMRDNGEHCNHSGAKVVSDNIAKFFYEKFEISDKRGNSRYASWDRCLEKYNKKFEKSV